MDRREFLFAAAAAPLALRAGRAWAGTVPVALVTADLEARIVVLDAVSGRIVRRIATPQGPRSVEAVGGHVAVVAHTAEGRLSVVDATRVRAVVDGLAQPRYAAAHPDGCHAFVTDSRRGEVVVVDVLRASVVGRAEVGAYARHVSLSRDARTLWVALGSKAAEVAVVDVAHVRRPRLVARFAPPFLAHDVGFAPDARRAWVTSGAERAVAIYDVRTRRRVVTHRADAPPQHVSFGAARAFVTSGGDNVLRVHALDGRLLRTTPVPWGSYNVQQAFGRVVTPSLEEGTVCVLDARGALVHRERVALSSHDAAFVLA